MENQPSGKNICLNETQWKIIYSKEIFHPTVNYENSILLAFQDENGIKRTIHCVCSTGPPGFIQVRSINCCCHTCIRMSGPCKVKHAHPWKTVAIKTGVDVAIMKRSHWDNFRMLPDMNPQKKYQVMENTKIKKRKTMHNVQDFNIEDKDDIPL